MAVRFVPETPATTRRVVEVDPHDDPRWLEFVSAHPSGLIYHHPAWLRVLELEYGRRPICLAVENDRGRFTGVLPLLQTRGLPLRTGSQLVGRRLCSLPRTPIAGPLVSEPTDSARLVAAALDLAASVPDCRLEIKALPQNEWMPETLQARPWRRSYILTLPDDPSWIRFGNARNHSRIRWAVNHATKNGVRIRSAETMADLRDWYRLYLETMRWHLMPPRSFRFFKGLWTILQPQGLMRLLLAEHNHGGKPRLLAGTILLSFNQTVFYAFNGRRREDLNLRPNDLIQWQAIHDACAEGYRYYDFGEVAENHEGLAKFKSKWDAEEIRLHRYYYPAVEQTETGTLVPTSRSRDVIGRIWQRTPLPLTSWVGNWIYRFM